VLAECRAKGKIIVATKRELHEVPLDLTTESGGGIYLKPAEKF
jgi:hypothetical protein